MVLSGISDGGPVQWAGVSSRLRFYPFADGEWLPHVMSARCDLT
jgi:hypothetical protein